MAKAKKKAVKKTVKKTTKKQKNNSYFEEIDGVIKEELKVNDIFTIEFVDEDDGGAIMNIGFTEMGNKAIDNLRKRNPKITEKDIEDYVRGISARLIVLLAEKIKDQEEAKKQKDE